MNCLKCGKETKHEQVFCDHCLDSMADCPVKPGTAVHLPKQAVSPVQKKAPARKKPLNQDELISLLKKLNLGLALTAAVLVVALALTVAALVHTGQALEDARNTGKNYSVETTPEA